MPGVRSGRDGHSVSDCPWVDVPECTPKETYNPKSSEVPAASAQRMRSSPPAVSIHHRVFWASQGRIRQTAPVGRNEEDDKQEEILFVNFM